MQKEKKDDLLLLIRQGKPMTTAQQLRLVLMLSTPAILAQLTTTMMQYIDAAMVGSQGANASASIGLVETTTWMMGSVCSCAAAGFYVQVAHLLGANDDKEARSVLRQALAAVIGFGCVMGLIGFIISPWLPIWLGGNEDINGMASAYFAIFSIGIPIFQTSMLGAGMLRSSGNMLVPSILSAVMMILDVVFNFFLIFPSRTVDFLGMELFIPGAGLSVVGAAIGTVSAETITASLLMYFLCFRSKDLRLTIDKGNFKPKWNYIKKALHIGGPMSIQQVIMSSAYIATTIIVAPLGTFAIAAHSFGIVIESLCYMPGYGIGDAATTLVGQSVGAGRRDLTRKFAYMSVVLGMGVMALMGLVMYIGAPFFMGMMTPVEEVRQLGVMALRIEAFAEPMFAAAIVCYGVFVGASDTLIPSGMNLLSMWVVRIPMSAILALSLGLQGVWIAMCLELCFRGIIFLCRLRWGNWMKAIKG